MTKHFPDYELECNCGCGLLNMRQSTMDKVERARVIAGIPFSVSSGSRCHTHNKVEGGTDTSSHLDGFALDIVVTSSVARFKILTTLLMVGFTRIGIGATFIHVDDDPNKSPEVSWVYH